MSEKTKHHHSRKKIRRLKIGKPISQALQSNVELTVEGLLEYVSKECDLSESVRSA